MPRKSCGNSDATVHETCTSGKGIFRISRYDPPDAAHHLAAARRAPELLRPRREGRELQQHRRLRLHADSRVLAAQLLKATTYTDETTLFYWAVLPAVNADGTGAVGDPLSAAASNFQKQSIPPSATSPADGALLTEQPIFRWTQVEGARRYRFQIAQEPTFATPLEDVTTAATSYTPFTTHPADTTLYWRVRADDENLIGLTWSAARTFQRRLPTPTADPNNATSGDFTPAWTGRT